MQRTFRPQPIGIALLAIVSFVAAQGTGIRIFFHLSYVLVALLLVSYAWAWLNLRGIELEREISTQRAQVGDFARERVTVINRWPLPKLWVELRDGSDMPQHGSGFVSYLQGGERRRWMIRTPCVMRGRFRLGPSVLTSGDPFGIFRVERRIAGSNELIVYPRTVPLTHFSLPSAELPGGQDTKSRTYHVTPNVAGVRDYAPGDSFNRIHWRTTARTGQLMVKEFELDPTAEVYIAIDLEERSQERLSGDGARGMRRLSEARAAESTEEYAIHAAASIAQQLLSENKPVGLVAWGQHREVIPPERESRQLYKILEALAILRAQGSQPLAEVLAAESARFGRNVSLVVITASIDERWVVSLQHLRYAGVRASVVYIDPQSFGGWRESQGVIGRLAVSRTTHYVYRQGQDLVDALR